MLLRFDADDESFWYSTKQAQRWLLTPLTSAATSAATSAPAAAPAPRGWPAGQADLDDFEIEEFSSLDELRQARVRVDAHLATDHGVGRCGRFISRKSVMGRCEWTVRTTALFDGGSEPVSSSAGGTDGVHVANPDALLKALDGPVVKFVR